MIISSVTNIIKLLFNDQFPIAVKSLVVYLNYTEKGINPDIFPKPKYKASISIKEIIENLDLKDYWKFGPGIFNQKFAICSNYDITLSFFGHGSVLLNR